MAQSTGDILKAKTHYERALEIAATKEQDLPIAAYQYAILQHEFASTFEADTLSTSCDLLTRAGSEASRDPEFYAELIDKIEAAQTDFGCAD